MSLRKILYSLVGSSGKQKGAADMECPTYIVQQTKLSGLSDWRITGEAQDLELIGASEVDP